MTDVRRVTVRVDGIVQGVGFRPFVYRTAVDNDLAGWVRNMGDAGVHIVLEGDPEDVDAFLETLRHDPPPLSKVETVEVDREPPEGLETFEIRASADASGGSGTVPPDTGVCSACLEDIRDPDSRYHGYWATACVDCGPRYTVIRGLPYDRPTTSMDTFPMCEACRAAYEDPANRRYHAQAIACPECGPQLTLEAPGGDPIAERTDAIRRTGDRVADGELVAIKGIGGAHLACDATDPAVVERLRERTGRPAKPFALMAASLEQVETFADVTSEEVDALTDIRRPIVLLEERDPRDWLEAVAPGLHTVGVMLPYSGLHHLLFDHVEGPLVMTSANLPGRPMCTTRAGIHDRLGDVIDAALVHDREIVMRCDDSVARVVGGEPAFIRRSRGWVPEPLTRPGWEPDGNRPTVLALGPEFDVTAAVTQDDGVIPSQYVGDVDDPETLEYLRATVEHLTSLTGATPDIVACDLHPEFRTTALAEEYATDRELEGPVRVQHHHAHAASLLAEHDLNRAVVITADGTGYGPDGSVWGGEVLDAARDDFERVGGLGRFGLPGGEAAVREPTRILATLLDDPERIDDLLVARGVVEDATEAEVVREQVDAEVNTPRTTSAGRTLDAVSALLDVAPRRRYEGEPAMCLEATAAGGTPIEYEVPYTRRNGTRVVAVDELLRDLDTLRTDHRTANIAATAQRAVGEGLADIAVEAADDEGLDAVGFTGGVAYNEAITETIHDRVEAAGLAFLTHRDVPPGDGGIAYGQVVVADARRA